MTDRGTHAQEMNKEVQHSKAQADAMSLRGVGQRTLRRSEDHLSDAQIALFARMRDEGAKISINEIPGLASDDPKALNAFLSARLAHGREVTRSNATDFRKLPRVARTTALRSIAGGHIERVAGHANSTQHYYGLTDSGLALLARHQTIKRQAEASRAK
ncbi:MAG: hypothetical protein ABIY70_01845 [Capsulimonas sp.]|uniref:hypothetical protein n=1 Tax=Capsulimonas sp. TaxID=2494211 RepID=UPI003264A34C